MAGTLPLARQSVRGGPFAILLRSAASRHCWFKCATGYSSQAADLDAGDADGDWDRTAMGAVDPQVGSEQQQRLPDAYGRPHVNDYNCRINHLATRERRSWLIRLVYEEMLVDGIPPDWTTFEEAMYQLMRARRVGDCLYFFKEMQRWGRQPNAFHYTLVISAYGRGGHVMSMFKAFDEMKAAGLQPHRQSFQSILNALAQKGSLRRIQEMADEMVAAGFDLDEHAYAALLRCYGKSPMAGGDTLPRILELLNKARTAVAELADVKQANPDPMDIVIVNAALASLGECGFHDEAVTLFETMTTPKRFHAISLMHDAMIASYLHDALGTFGAADKTKLRGMVHRHLISQGLIPGPRRRDGEQREESAASSADEPSSSSSSSSSSSDFSSDSTTSDEESPHGSSTAEESAGDEADAPASRGQGGATSSQPPDDESLSRNDSYALLDDAEASLGQDAEDTDADTLARELNDDDALVARGVRDQRHSKLAGRGVPTLSARSVSQDERLAGRDAIIQARRAVKQAQYKSASFDRAMELFEEAELHRMLVSPERCRDLILTALKFHSAQHEGALANAHHVLDFMHRSRTFLNQEMGSLLLKAAVRRQLGDLSLAHRLWATLRLAGRSPLVEATQAYLSALKSREPSNLERINEAEVLLESSWKAHRGSRDVELVADSQRRSRQDPRRQHYDAHWHAHAKAMRAA